MSIKYFETKPTMTLGEAISNLRAFEGQNDMTETMSSEIEESFEQHDAVHVLFGCGTSIQDEIAAHIYMLFGTTAKVGEMHKAVAAKEHRSVLSGIGHFKLTGIWIGCVPRIARIILNCLRMKKKVAFEEIASLKNQSLSDIRREHGIRF